MSYYHAQEVLCRLLHTLCTTYTIDSCHHFKYCTWRESHTRWGRAIDEGFVGVSVRLRNSDVLVSLDKKLSYLSTEERNDVAELVQEFAHLFLDTPKRTKLVMHAVDVGNASPCKQHLYRVNPQKLLHLQKKIEYMLKNKLIEPSNSEWSSPCIFVPKPDGSFRYCTDFCKLNAVTKSD